MSIVMVKTSPRENLTESMQLFVESEAAQS